MRLVMMLLCSLMMSAASAGVPAKSTGVKVETPVVEVVQMSSSKILKQELTDAGFAHFYQNSSIGSSLGGRWLSKQQATLRVERRTNQYVEIHEGYAAHMALNKHVLFKIILKNFSSET